MTTYDNPYRKAKLLECSDPWGSLGDAFGTRKEYARVMSPAALDVIERVVMRWFERPGVLCCRLNIPEQAVDVHISAPDENDHIASYSLPLAELVLSAAQTSEEDYRLPPSTVSSMLRKLADEIDTIGKEA